MARILITGASGRVGGALVRELAGKRPILAAARQSLHEHPEIPVVPFDVTDPATFDPALVDVEAIFLMRPPHIADAKAFRPFLERAQEKGIRRLVVLTVLGADKNRWLPHHGLEKLVEEMGFDWTMIRPSDFMQNLETVHLEGIRRHNEIAVPAGTGKSAFIDVDDIAAAIAHVLLSDGHDQHGYDLTGPEALDFAHVADALSQELGRAIRYRHVSVPSFLFEKLRARAPLGITLVMAALYTVQRLGKAETVTSQLEPLIGRAPTRLGTYLNQNRAVFLPKEGSVTSRA